jgi:hypothetical protein
MPQDGSPYMGWLGREAPGISAGARLGALSNNPKDAIGRTKTPMHLIPPTALVEMARVMGLGAEKYGPYNWRDASVAATVYLAAGQRHIVAFLDGENADPESGASHLAHAAACMSILIDAFATGNVVDDRPKPGPAAAMMAGVPPWAALDRAMGWAQGEAQAHRAAQGQNPEGNLTPMERELFCAKVKEQNPPPPAAAARDFLWYLATPYTAAPDGKPVAWRFAADALCELLRREVRVFSPIAHTHIAGALLRQDHEFWMAADRPFMARCDGLLVLRQPGWKESRGVTEEIQTFAKAGKPVLFFDDPNLEYARIQKSQAADWDTMVNTLRAAERSPELYGRGAA